MVSWYVSRYRFPTWECWYVGLSRMFESPRGAMRKGRDMTSTQLYDLLDKAGVQYEIVEIFEGMRILGILVNDEEEN